MRFEIAYSLTDLDRRTPEFFRREVLAEEGDGATRRAAIAVLGSPASGPVVALLRELLRQAEAAS